MIIFGGWSLSGGQRATFFLISVLRVVSLGCDFWKGIEMIGQEIALSVVSCGHCLCLHGAWHDFLVRARERLIRLCVLGCRLVVEQAFLEHGDLVVDSFDFALQILCVLLDVLTRRVFLCRRLVEYQ